MQLDRATSRPQYRPSGKVRWAAFLPWTALALAVSIGMGCALHAAYYNGFYAVALAPAVASLPVLGLGYLSVGLGQCRSRSVAVAFGLAAAVLLYGTYFHAGLVQLLGVQHLHKLDLLPGYVEFRMNTDVLRDKRVERPQNNVPRPADRPNVYANVAFSAFDLLIIIVAVTPLAWKRAVRPYCETHQRWMIEESATFAHGSGPLLARALHTGSPAAWAGFSPPRSPTTSPHTAVYAYYCPANASSADPCPVYVSVNEVDKVKKQWNTGRFVGRGRWLLDRCELSPTEVAALVPIFPALAPSSAGSPLSRHPADRSAPPTDPSAVDVRPLPTQFSDKILGGKGIALGNILTLLVLVFFYAGLAMALGGAYLVWQPDALGAVGPPLAQLLGGTLVAVGALFASVCGYVGLQYPSFLGNIYLLRLARREFLWRPDLLVDPNNPDAVFVEVCPRQNWHQLKLETATDIGFLLVDTRRRQLLFEGDKERYRIPADALVACEMEQLNPMGGSFTLFMVVIHAQRDAALWELPIARRFHPVRDISVDRRRQRALELRDHIRTLIPADVAPLDVFPADVVLLEEE